MIDPNDIYAHVEGRGTTTELERYLPANYKLERVIRGDADEPGQVEAIIIGYDHQGWTLDGYVIPRFASGLWSCTRLTYEEAEVLA